MPILDAVKEQVARGAERVARADMTSTELAFSVVDGVREWLAPTVEAAKDRLAPAASAAKDRLTPAARAVKARLAPVMEPLAPMIERVREAASGFGEIAVGSAPEAEEVVDPVQELEAYFEADDALEFEPQSVVPLGVLSPMGAAQVDEELEVPPHEPWALSTLDDDEEEPPLRRVRPRERLTLV